MIYRIPPDTSDKEKIFGGMLSMGQVVWLVLGIILAFLVFLLLSPIFGKFALILALPFLGTGVPFAFMKKEDLPLATYLIKLMKHKKTQHIFKNEIKNKED